MGLRGGVRVELSGLGSRLRIPTTSSIGISPRVKRSPRGSEGLSMENMGMSAENGTSEKRGLQRALLGTAMSCIALGKRESIVVAMVLSGKFTC
jgi:hypothetical protein